MDQRHILKKCQEKFFHGQLYSYQTIDLRLKTQVQRVNCNLALLSWGSFSTGMKHNFPVSLVHSEDSNMQKIREPKMVAAILRICLQLSSLTLPSLISSKLTHHRRKTTATRM